MPKLEPREVMEMLSELPPYLQQSLEQTPLVRGARAGIAEEQRLNDPQYLAELAEVSVEEAEEALTAEQAYLSGARADQPQHPKRPKLPKDQLR
ncbi:hypothetical protein [Halochromatium salexigens]|uniref:Uncharacterized protein n=1 Tax=Halochromatium salexigens TaxID=49447 RepID=A0AAJ0UES8_HALSE|nr:hypothetical protein [Halochromatium salexigens]MBK5929272.1 hypothetical protein [Halochromatium salexigens]